MQSLTFDLIIKNKLHTTKIVSLKSFKYESNNISFMTYYLYFVSQIYSQSGARNTKETNKSGRCSTLSMYTIYIGDWSFLLAKHGHSQHDHNQGWGEGEYAAAWVDCHVDIKNVGWCKEVLEP